jgi:hypothetical protein
MEYKYGEIKLEDKLLFVYLSDKEKPNNYKHYSDVMQLANAASKSDADIFLWYKSAKKIEVHVNSIPDFRGLAYYLVLDELGQAETVASYDKKLKEGIRIPAHRIGILGVPYSPVISGGLKSVDDFGGKGLIQHGGGTTEYAIVLPEIKYPLKTTLDDLLDMQLELRNLLYVRPYNLQDIESKAMKLCNAVVKYSEENN